MTDTIAYQINDQTLEVRRRVYTGHIIKYRVWNNSKMCFITTAFRTSNNSRFGALRELLQIVLMPGPRSMEIEYIRRCYSDSVSYTTPDWLEG